jgi:hypothetical protein
MKINQLFSLKNCKKLSFYSKNLKLCPILDDYVIYLLEPGCSCQLSIMEPYWQQNFPEKLVIAIVTSWPVTRTNIRYSVLVASRTAPQMMQLNADE